MLFFGARPWESKYIRNKVIAISCPRKTSAGAPQRKLGKARETWLGPHGARNMPIG